MLDADGSLPGEVKKLSENNLVEITIYCLARSRFGTSAIVTCRKQVDRLSKGQDSAAKRDRLEHSSISGGSLSAALVVKDVVVLMDVTLDDTQELFANSDNALIKSALQESCHILQCPFQELLDYLEQGVCVVEVKIDFILAHPLDNVCR